MVEAFVDKETKNIRKQIKSIKKKLEKCPPGDLICTRNRKYFKWYESNGSEPIYIPKKDRKHAEELAIKKYYTLQLQELEDELEFYNHYVEYLNNKPEKSKDLLERESGYRSLLQTYFETYPGKTQTWLEEEYLHNLSYPENLIHEVNAGHYVRSKSEEMIANSLYRNKIPYRYECGLTINGITLFPDFTILHPKTMDVYYWEHFGIMDDQSYRDRVYNKLKMYGNFHIIPDINLITTYETLNYPLNSVQVERKIQEKFI